MAEIKNPNQGSGSGGRNDNTMLIMLIVVAGVLFGLQYFRSKRTAPLATNPPVSQQQQSSTAPPAMSAMTGPAMTAGATSAAPSANVTANAESTTVIENELYRIEFTNRGAQVRSWVLKRYHDRVGNLLDLVNPAAAKEVGYPLSLYTYDSGLTAQLAQAMYVPSVTGNLRSPQTLTFRYSAAGLDVTKTFSFDDSYVLKADVVATRNGAPVRTLLAWPGGFGDQTEIADFNTSQMDTLRDGDSKHTVFSKVSGGNTLDAPIDYTGVTDQFFGAIFIPSSAHSATAVSLHNTVDIARLSPHARGVTTGKAIAIPIIGTAVGDVSGHSQLSLFAGPKSYTLLKTIDTPSGANLASVVDFGFWGYIGRYLFFALHFLQEHGIPNWGWAIVVFTVLINLVLLPLRISSMKSALKMQRLQPQMDAIKQRYAKYKATDPKKGEMNTEIMALQRDNGVNMFAGCVPTLIQLPLLFAMFSMLTKVVELRQAHWFWLHDLTAADPYHILPIFMVVSQFLVQFYMPSPGVDPQQQRMMAFMMPAFSGYMTWNYAAGLALYWCTGNIIMIIQQYAMNRTPLGQEMRAIAAKRAAKKAGKVIQARR